MSPQRRSFNSGCCVPGREPRISTNRPHSPLGKSDNNSHIGGVRDIQPNSRRIGSGRILRDNWDLLDKQDGENDYNFRPQQRNSENQDRRSFGRDFESVREREKEKERRSGSRFNDRRRISGESRDEEPEWFSGGPLSQNDTIELRGFDDSERLNKKKMSPSQAKRARDWFKKKTETASVTEEKEEIHVEGGPGARSTPTPQAGDEIQENDKPTTLQHPNNTKSVENGDRIKANHDKSMTDQSFIFEDILKSDSIPGLPGFLTVYIPGGLKAIIISFYCFRTE